jgi:hypothetical protein
MNGGLGLHPRQCRVPHQGAQRRHVDHCVGIVDAYAHLGPRSRNDHFVKVTGRRRQGAVLTGPTPRSLRSTIEAGHHPLACQRADFTSAAVTPPVFPPKCPMT